MPTRTALALCLLATVALAAVGCKTAQDTHTFSPDTGLPDDRYIVGGGFSIEYVARADGTAIWADQATERILATYSLEEGEPVEIAADPNDDAVRAIFGNDLEDARPMLYFLPEKPAH
ncbi:MAG: hypothetical protein AAF823_14915 [Planctomycetota bacterium]